MRHACLVSKQVAGGPSTQCAVETGILVAIIDLYEATMSAHTSSNGRPPSHGCHVRVIEDYPRRQVNCCDLSVLFLSSNTSFIAIVVKY